MVKRSTLNRMFLMSFMVVITVVGMGKVAMPFLGDQVAQSPVVPKITIKQNSKTVVNQDWTTEWLNQNIIPSAEAAENMPLQEEQNAQNNGAAKIIEMREKQKQLNAYEKELDERKTEAEEAEKRAKDKIAELVALEIRIQSMLAEEKSIKDKKIKRLTAVYEGMKADRAAPVIAQMKLDIVVKIFSRMSEKQVGKILSFLSPKQAVVISQALTERIASVK